MLADNSPATNCFHAQEKKRVVSFERRLTLVHGPCSALK